MMTRTARLSLMTAVVVVAGYVTGTAGASVPPSGTLWAPDGGVSWSGAFEEAYSFVSLPELCPVVGCDEFTLTVDLPAGVWALPGDGVQIAINWPDEANDLDLFVYGPDGSLAAKSDGFFASTGEAVRILNAVNGDYRAVVVPRFVEGRMDYQGFAEVERQAAVQPLRDLLPNLVPLPPRNLHLAIGAYVTDPGFPGELSSCYPEEMIEQGARKCLRFDQEIANTGEGPFELRYRMEGIATDQQLRQRIYRSDSSVTDRVADTYEFHAAHAHFHYRNFAQSRLWASNEARERLGDAPVRVTRKNGFCMIDVSNTKFGPGHKGEAPRTYYFPRCNAPTERDDSGTYMTNGISSGWTDVYNWFLADQFIEVSDLAPGLYLLETEADAANTVLETTKADNVAATLVRINADGTVEAI